MTPGPLFSSGATGQGVLFMGLSLPPGMVPSVAEKLIAKAVDTEGFLSWVSPTTVWEIPILTGLENVPFWGLVSHHQNNICWKLYPPYLGDVQFGHLPTPD